MGRYRYRGGDLRRRAKRHMSKSKLEESKDRSDDKENLRKETQTDDK